MPSMRQYFDESDAYELQRALDTAKEDGRMEGIEQAAMQAEKSIGFTSGSLEAQNIRALLQPSRERTSKPGGEGSS